ncbi:MAG: hypothetical protein V7637_6485 [Mycobacteriales bacterium]|jgi:hypothetical protein
MITPLAASLLRALAPVDRDTARDAAARELSKGIYHADDPSLLQRLADRVVRWLDSVGNALGAGPGGGAVGLIAILVVVGGLTALILWRTGPLRRSSARGAGGIELSGQLDAGEHRRRADAYAEQQRYADAVRERMRAIVRELEARAVLDSRPGRTADEIAREAGALVPQVAGDLRYAARIFEEIWYAGRPATMSMDVAMRAADRRVASARLAVGVPVPAGSGGYVMPQ